MSSHQIRSLLIKCKLLSMEKERMLWEKISFRIVHQLSHGNFILGAPELNCGIQNAQ